jgi:hypothetical protein
MAEPVVTLLAALIGAVLGSVGAVFAQHLLTRRVEEAREREALAGRYLFQLQDAAETLWHRLNNLAYKGGRLVMDDGYFEHTTLYAFGRVLAAERIVALEGAYSQINSTLPGLGEFLREHRVDLRLQGTGFYQYNRVSLAEAAIQREGNGFRITTYLEFRRRYEAGGTPEREWLGPAREAIRSMDEKTTSVLLGSLAAIASRIASETGVPSSLPSQSSQCSGAT